MRNEDLMFAIDALYVVVKDIRDEIKYQNRKTDTERRTLSRTDLESFLREYYGPEAKIKISRGGYTIDVYPQIGTDTTHG